MKRRLVEDDVEPIDAELIRGGVAGGLADVNRGDGGNEGGLVVSSSPLCEMSAVS